MFYCETSVVLHTIIEGVSVGPSSTLPMPLPGYQVEPSISTEASVDISSIKKGKEKLVHLFL